MIDIKSIQDGDRIRLTKGDESMEIVVGELGIQYAVSSVNGTYVDIRDWDTCEIVKTARLEATWGMVIGDPNGAVQRAVYIPAHHPDILPWLTNVGWQSSDWAEDKIRNQGWRVLTAPPGLES